jgi:hypothetical protein
MNDTSGSPDSKRLLTLLDLPPEILLQILRCHFWGFDGSKRPPNYYAPIQVWGTLRRLALDDRQCWSTIEITIDFPSMLASIPRLADNPNLGDYKPTVMRLLSEAKWRLDRVQDLPIDLNIRLHDQLESNEAYVYVQAIPVINMVREFMHTTFDATKGMGPRINAYQEDGYSLFENDGYSFFNDIISVLRPCQYETLTLLQLKCSHLRSELTFPSLVVLFIFGCGCTFETLSKITAPSLKALRVHDFGNHLQEAAGIYYLAPLLARFPDLRAVDLSGTFSANFLPPQGPAGYQHPSVGALGVSADETYQWEFSTFVRAFPNLRMVFVMDLETGINMDELGNIPRANNVTELIFVRARNVDAKVIRAAMEAFPNLKRLTFGPSGVGLTGTDPLIHGGEVFRLLAQIIKPDSEDWTQERWPHLKTITLGYSVFDKAGFLAWLWFLQVRFMHSWSTKSYKIHPWRIKIKDCRLHWGELPLDDPTAVPEAPSHWHRLPALDSRRSWTKFRLALEEVLMSSIGLSVEEIVKETDGLLGTSDNWMPRTEHDAKRAWKIILESAIASM